MFLSVLFVVLLVIISIVCSIRKPHNYPPGPSWLPIVGCLPAVKKLARKFGGQHLAIQELNKQFNTNLLGLKLGQDLVVSVSSYPLIKKLFTSQDFDDRPDNFFVRFRNMGTKKGITCSDGKFWMEQRNFVIRQLRNVGFAKTPMEIQIKEELKETIELIEKQGIVEIGTVLQHSVINVLWSFVAGTRINKDDPFFNKLFDILRRRSKAFDMSGGTLSHYPWMRFIAPERIGYNLIKNLNAELKQFFMEAIEEHAQSWSEDNKDDLIHRFITEMKRANGQPTNFTIEQLVMICLDLFIAGAHTTSGSVDFALLMMLLRPDVQVKAQKCVDDVLGDRELNYTDRNKLHYIEAVLAETDRYCTVLPIMGPRACTKDVVLEGYTVPKNSVVLVNVYSILMSKEIWGDPETFRPERFLDAEGKFIPHDALMPFALGKRRCLGEPLAKTFTFIFFVEMLKHFTVKPVDITDLPSTKPLPGIVLLPQKYSAKFVKRHY